MAICLFLTRLTIELTLHHSNMEEFFNEEEFEVFPNKEKEQ